MEYRRKRGSAGGARSMSSELMGLSLFVIMLAFFIVLNAISLYEEEKLKPVMESLDSAFVAQYPAGGRDRPFASSGRDGSEEGGDSLDRIKALFTARIPGHKIVRSRRGGVMRVSVPLEEFEKAVMALQESGQPAGEQGFQKDFLPMLAALVKTAESGVSYKMDIVLEMKESPASLANGEPQKIAQAIGRLSAIAAKIEEAGVPAGQISVGAQQGEEGTVNLFFRPYEPFDPAGKAGAL